VHTVHRSRAVGNSISPLRNEQCRRNTSRPPPMGGRGVPELRPAGRSLLRPAHAHGGRVLVYCSGSSCQRRQPARCRPPRAVSPRTIDSNHEITIPCSPNRLAVGHRHAGRRGKTPTHRRPSKNRLWKRPTRIQECNGQTGLLQRALRHLRRRQGQPVRGRYCEPLHPKNLARRRREHVCRQRRAGNRRRIGRPGAVQHALGRPATERGISTFSVTWKTAFA